MATDRRHFLKTSAAIVAAGAIGMPMEDTLMHHGITDFAANPTVRSVSNGSWNDPAVWDTATVPNADDVVLVLHDVVINKITDVIAMSIGVSGSLEIHGILLVKDLLIYEEGSLFQFAGSITIRDLPPTDPKQWGTGIICLGEWRAIGTEITPYSRATHDLKAGDDQVTLEEVPIGWTTGDVVVFPRTAQRLNGGKSSLEETERAVVVGISDNKVTFMPPLQFDHLGLPDNPWGLVAFPHVGHITRSIYVRSENPEGNRGHTTCVGEAVDCKLHDVGFFDLGRTSAFSKAIDGDPMNQRGRYPIHFHHTRQSPVSVANCAIVGNRKWGIAIHDADGGMYAHNVIVDSDGSAIATEDGDEINNHIVDNLIIQVNRFAKTQQSDGSSGDGIWSFASGNNYLGNMIYDCKGFGINVDGYGRRGPHRTPGIVDGNEAWACRGGLWFTWSQFFGNHNDSVEQIVTNTLVVNCRDEGVKAYHETKLTFDGLTIICTPEVSSKNPGGGGVDTRCCTGIDIRHTYETHDFQFREVKIYGVNIGMQASDKPGLLGTSLKDAEISAYLPIWFGKENTASVNQVNVTILPSTVTRVGSMPEIAPPDPLPEIDLPPPVEAP